MKFAGGGYFRGRFCVNVSPQLKGMPLQLRLVFILVLLQVCSFGQTGLKFKQDAIDDLKKGDFINAVENLNVAIEKEPGLPELFYLRGYAKYSLDDYMGAEQDYSHSIELSPYMAEVFLNRAIVRSQLENFKGAMEDFDRAMAMDPKNGEIWFYRARTNLYLKKHYSCLVDCNKAIQLRFGGEAVYVLKASAEQEVKRFTEAIEDLDAARRINPQNGYVFVQRGLVWVDMNQVDSAIVDFGRAVRLDSANTYALFNRALAYLKIPDQVKALRDLNAVIRISPYNAYAYYNRAIVLIGLKEKRGAIRDFEIVSKLDPKNIISYYYRSKLKAELHDYQGALDDLNKTLDLLPDYTDAFYDRYEVKLKMKDMKGAQADYKQAMELSRKNHYNPDSLKAERKDYLKSLVKLSGDFEQMNTMNSKLQNQAVDIRLKPMFSLLLWKVDFEKVKVYDAFKKEHYFTNLISFANQPGIVGDSILHAEIGRQSHRIDSAGVSPLATFKRGVSWSLLRTYDRAIRDFDTVLAADSGFIMAWFSRAVARYELIQLINVQDDYQRDITIGKTAAKPQNPPLTAALEHTYGAVIGDYDRVLALDPGLAFAWYNRGYVNSQMGNYRAAIEDFSKAISLRNDFAEAWFNRGLLNIMLNENRAGCNDLSRAGELGIGDAYRVMKRYCYK